MYLTRTAPYGSSNVTMKVTWPCQCWHRVEAGGASRPGYHFDSCGVANHNKRASNKPSECLKFKNWLVVMEEGPRTINGLGSPIIGDRLKVYHRVLQLVVSAL